MNRIQYPSPQDKTLALTHCDECIVPVRSRGFEVYRKNMGFLVGPENIQGRRVLEIGGGGSDFLIHAKEMGAQSVLGIDPIFEAGVEEKLIRQSEEIINRYPEIMTENSWSMQKEKTIYSRIINAVKHLQITQSIRRRIFSVLIKEFVSGQHTPLLKWAEDFKRHPERYQPRELPNTELPDDAFNVVLSHWCFPFHFNSSDVFWPALDELLRITAPGGKVILHPFLFKKRNNAFREKMPEYLDERGFRMHTEREPNVLNNTLILTQKQEARMQSQ